MSVAKTTADEGIGPAKLADALVRAIGVSRRYGEGQAAVDALVRVSVEFEPGTFTAVMGPSGSGKSTLLHVLAGLDKPTEGAVWIDGREITTLNDRRLTLLRRQKIGFVFQFFNLLPMLTAEENIELPLKISGQKIDPQLKRHIIETMNLGDRLHHRPAQLSGGQQQRVAIARALIAHPSVIFADEPTGNLDSGSTHEVLQLLRAAVDSMGHTIIMVTHEPAAAAAADRILFLSDGEVVRDIRASGIDQILQVMGELG